MCGTILPHCVLAAAAVAVVCVCVCEHIKDIKADSLVVKGMCPISPHIDSHTIVDRWGRWGGWGSPGTIQSLPQRETIGGGHGQTALRSGCDSALAENP